MNRVVYEVGHAPIVMTTDIDTVAEDICNGIIRTLDAFDEYDVYYIDSRNIIYIDSHIPNRSNNIGVYDNSRDALDVALQWLANGCSDDIHAHWVGDGLQAVTTSNGFGVDRFADIVIVDAFANCKDYRQTIIQPHYDDGGDMDTYDNDSVISCPDNNVAVVDYDIKLKRHVILTASRRNVILITLLFIIILLIGGIIDSL